MDAWIQILASAVGIAVVAASASLSYFFAKRSQLRADECRLKEKCYLDYISALSDNVLIDNRDDSRSRLSDAHNHILLIGSSDVVDKLRHFTRLIAIDNKEGFTKGEHDMSLTELIKSMRVDLYKKRKVNDNYPQISLSGKVDNSKRNS